MSLSAWYEYDPRTLLNSVTPIRQGMPATVLSISAK
jgi:hypothetical protein